KVARSHLEDHDAFFGFIDIKRARMSSIRPLPVRISTSNGWEILDEPENLKSTIVIDVPEQLTIHEGQLEQNLGTTTKQKQWERSLLDLSLRNTLLNFRLTKSMIPLLNVDLGALE